MVILCPLVISAEVAFHCPTEHLIAIPPEEIWLGDVVVIWCGASLLDRLSQTHILAGRSFLCPAYPQPLCAWTPSPGQTTGTRRGVQAGDTGGNKNPPPNAHFPRRRTLRVLGTQNSLTVWSSWLGKEENPGRAWKKMREKGFKTLLLLV